MSSAPPPIKPAPARPNRLPRRDRIYFYAAALIALVTGCAGFLLKIDGYHLLISFAGGVLAIVAGLNPFNWFKGQG